MSKFAIKKKTAKPEDQKRRRELFLTIGIIVLIVLFSHFETQLFKNTVSLPLSNGILALALINLNILLVVLFLFLVFRNIFKLIIEKHLNTNGFETQERPHAHAPGDERVNVILRQ